MENQAEQKDKLNHVAVILDGNRRFAKNKGHMLWKGHDSGAETFENFLKWCKELEIKEVTAYILSTENLKREPEELNHLFNLFKKWFEKFENHKEIEKNKIKIKFIGDLSLVPADIKKMAEDLQEKTKKYNERILNFCFAYGGRLEITQAVNKLLKEGKKSVTEADITKALWLSNEPQLIIRTGNTIRTSNFLPWQSAYSEWVFLDKMWPEFTKEDLIQCIEDFKARKRSFGK